MYLSRIIYVLLYFGFVITVTHESSLCVSGGSGPSVAGLFTAALPSTDGEVFHRPPATTPYMETQVAQARQWNLLK